MDATNGQHVVPRHQKVIKNYVVNIFVNLISRWGDIMSKNYFAIERGDKCWDHVNPIEINNERFKQFTDMTYEEIYYRLRLFCRICYGIGE